MTEPMERPAAAPRRWARTGRACLRSGVRALVAAALALVALLLYLHEVGLPERARRRLAAELLRSGIEFDCRRLRLRFYGGLVADHAVLRRTGGGEHDEASAEEVIIGFDWGPLAHLDPPTVDGLTLRRARLVVPLQDASGPQPVYRFAVEDVDARVRFTDVDAWSLDWLEARTAAGRVRASGSLTNLAVLRGAAKGGGARPGQAWKQDLLRFARTMDELQCTTPPVLDLAFQADLLHPERSSAHARLSAEGARLGDVRVGTVDFLATLNERPSTNGLLALTWRLDATTMAGRDWRARRIHFEGNGSQALTDDRPRGLSWSLEADGLSVLSNHLAKATLAGETVATNGGLFLTRATAALLRPATPWGAASRADLTLEGLHPMAGPVRDWRLDALDASCRLEAPASRWGGAAVLHGRVTAKPPEGDGWRELRAWKARAAVELTNAVVQELPAKSISVIAHWEPPTLRLESLETEAAGGRAAASGAWDTDTGALSASATNTMDAHQFARFLGPITARWLEQFTWAPETPPRMQAHATARWPNPGDTNVLGGLLDSLVLEGVVDGVSANYRGAFINTAHVPIALSNHMWLLRDIKAKIPSGDATIDYTEWIGRRDYYIHARGVADPPSVAPAVSEGVVRGLREFSFGPPVEVDVEYWGRWYDLSRSSVRGSAKARDFTFRGEPVRSAEGSVYYTNGWLHAEHARLEHASGAGTVGGLEYDIAGKRIFFTNTMSSLDPTVVARTIGPMTARMLVPYEFPEPPAVTLGGWIPTETNSPLADAWFEVAAPRFQWWKLRATNVSARLMWQGRSLRVTNAAGRFHGGKFTGSLVADLGDPDAPLLHFDAYVTNTQIQPLLTDLTGKTNHLEGLLTGEINAAAVQAVTNGAWMAHGSASLSDGLLWDLPLFGGVSTLLDQISPGLGQTRFTAGTASFTVTNHDVRTSDLEFRSPTMRLLLAGKVNFEGRLDGHLEAELLRDVPVVGPLVSLVLRPFTKLFEYDVKGTLAKPEFGMRYVPSFLLAPLRPFHWLKVLVAPSPPATNNPAAATGTNAPAAPPPPGKSP